MLADIKLASKEVNLCFVQDGEVQCNEEICKEVLCEEYDKDDNECCPRCVGKLEKN